MVADDGDSFTKVLCQLIDDTGFRAELAEAAYQYAQSRFSPEICFDSLLSLLSK
jgi:glycosyltransferase involved in cell wall biosynthesis